MATPDILTVYAQAQPDKLAAIDDRTRCSGWACSRATRSCGAA
jgi:hypothetical protein